MLAYGVPPLALAPMHPLGSAAVATSCALPPACTRLMQVSDDGEAAAGEEDDGELLQGGPAEALPPGRLEGPHGARRRSSGSLGGFASEIEADPEALQAAGSGSSGALAARAQRAGAYSKDEPELLGEGARGAAAGRPGAAGGLIPAVRRSGALPSRPPRYPSKDAAAATIPGPKEQPGAAAVPGPMPQSPSSLHQRNQAHLAQQSPPARSAFLQHRRRDYSAGLTASAVPGALAGGAASPGAAATASALRSAAASAVGRSGRRQLDVEAAARGLVAVARGAAAGSESYSFGPPAAPAPAPKPGSAQHKAPEAAAEQSVQGFPVAPSSYAPSSYAPSEGIPSSRQSPHSARTAGGAPAPAAPAHAALAQRLGQRLGGNAKLLSRLNRGPGLGDSASGSRHEAYSRIRWAGRGPAEADAQQNARDYWALGVPGSVRSWSRAGCAPSCLPASCTSSMPCTAPAGLPALHLMGLCSWAPRMACPAHSSQRRRAEDARLQTCATCSDEDIYGALEGRPSRLASIMNPSPRQVRPRCTLSCACAIFDSQSGFCCALVSPAPRTVWRVRWQVLPGAAGRGASSAAGLWLGASPAEQQCAPVGKWMHALRIVCRIVRSAFSPAGADTMPALWARLLPLTVWRLCAHSRPTGPARRRGGCAGARRGCRAALLLPLALAVQAHP